MSKLTYLVFLLDETGSMASIKDDTIGGFNAFLDALVGDFEVTAIKWDSSKQDVVCSGAAPKDVPRLTKDTYVPGAATPLVDVFYKAIKRTEEKIAGREVQVQIVVQTDGHENASVEHTSDELHALVKAKTAEGWLFTFVGAGIDAFDAAGKFGISATQTMSYDRHTSAQAFAALSRGTVAYAASGSLKDAAFTDAERAATGGHYAAPPPKAEDKPDPLVKVDW